MKIFAEEEETGAEQTKSCLYLNGVRANFTACCEYPAIVVWEWQMSLCVDECTEKLANVDEAELEDAERCCILVCNLNAIKILSSKTEASPLEASGFIHSFMLSVGNETIWEPVITNAINRCFSQNEGSDQGFDCGIIPVAIYSIADCAYLEHFLKCPKWNPSGLSQCVYTHQYAKECISNGMDIDGGGDEGDEGGEGDTES